MKEERNQETGIWLAELSAREPPKFLEDNSAVGSTTS